MDAYNKYPVTYITKGTGIKDNRDQLDEIMFDVGPPGQIWSDNGAPYDGKEWIRWTKSWNITPKFTTAYHPQANGMVERFNASLKKTIHAAIAEGKDPKKAVKKFVFAYRNTPHSTTGEKPSKLFYNRDLNDKIPTPTKKPRGKHHDNARRRAKEAKKKAKDYTDAKKHAKEVKIEVGDTVLI